MDLRICYNHDHGISESEQQRMETKISLQVNFLCGEYGHKL
jgi:hypothetical protein